MPAHDIDMKGEISMNKKIITISRQFGSGGRTIGKQLAEALGIKCYDREIIDEVAEKSGFVKEYIEKNGEYAPNNGPFGFINGRGIYNGLSNEDRIWVIQTKLIKELAEKEACVIVGRCADYILKDRDDVLRVFIHSDMKSRAERIVSVYGESDVAPEKRLKDKDKRRAAYYQYYTDVNWGDVKNYDVCLNSGALGIDKCVEVLKSLVE